MPTPPEQHAPMPTQSLAPAGWWVALARALTFSDGDATLETPK